MAIGSNTPKGSKVANGSNLNQRARDLLAALFAVLTGSLIFLPTVIDTVSPPFVLGWLLPAYWMLACVSLILLAASYYCLQFKDPPSVLHRTMGVGVLAGVGALASLPLYVVANMVQDRAARVRVVSIDVTPSEVALGDVIKLTATAMDQNGDDCVYRWSIEGQPIGNGSTVYWVVSGATQPRAITLDVDDGNPSHASRATVSVIVRNKEQPMRDNDEALIKGVRDGLSVLRDRNPVAHASLTAALQTDDAIVKLAGPIDWNSADARVRLVQSAFLRAVDVYSQDLWIDWWKGKRPPCSKYPGTFPFCDPSR